MSTESAPVTTRPLRRDAQRNRELLLAAAREVFAERGLEAPLEEIARRAGVSIGTLYNRFPSRVDLVDAALTELVETSVRIAERALANPDPWQGLVEHFTAIAELQVADRGFTDICVYALPPGSATERAKRRGAELTLALCERAQRAGVLRPDVTLTDLVLLVWAVVRASDGVRAVAPGVWRRHLALLLDGLRSDAAHPLPGQPLDPERLRQAMAFR
ncbi:MAG TPA: helix-turn-helix domain-containing protein [Pseudonocardia sp.]|uniref:TetR/AcrR family transcriptional regulator n=1 Tax=Pseudonocardia sp. TaxID=60912 RepID=UPI002C51CE6D|nr:helix-turn-helix domain-containing protein [Pseudonocardia sp.]HTF55113.1 helix-turn-helix domain-containing protein [Pseudonocardia sp.]